VSGPAGPPVRAVSDPPDLRLAGLALATWLAALAGLRLTAGAGLVAAASSTVVASVAAVMLARGPAHRSRWLWRHGWIGLAVLLGVVCGSTATAARVLVRDAEPLAGLVQEHAEITVELMLRDDPRRVRSTTARVPVWLIPARFSGLTEPGGRRVITSARLLVLGTDAGWAALLPGQRVSVAGRLMPSRGGDLTAGVLATDDPPLLLGQPGWAQRVAGSLRAGLRRACAAQPAEPGGLLPGLVVGDTSRLDPGVEDDFRTTGLTHLLAVSGSNVAIIIGFVLLLVRWGRAGPWLAATACAVALVGFVILARPSPSVVRAAMMGAIGLLALATGRPRAAVPALGAAITILVVVDPQLASDAGFALSVLATGGLLLLAPRWRDAMIRRGVPSGAAEALAIPAAAQLACTPVVAGLAGVISLVAVPVNLLVVPAIAPATVLGVAAAVISPVWPAGAEVAAWLGCWPARWLVVVARYGAAVPAGALPWPDGVVGALSLAGLTVAVLVAVRRRMLRRLVAVVAVGAMVGALPVRIVGSGWPPAGWVVVVCAVGQGDTVVLPVGPGAAVVVDTGPDPTAVDRCLRRLGVRSVPVLLVSHFHTDHMGGLTGVLRRRQVGAVATTAWSEPAAGRDAVYTVAATRSVGVGPVSAGWTYRHGELELAVIGPPEELTGTRSDPNNNSLVLFARVREVRILLTGDAEHEEQRALLDRSGPGGLRAEVLKVAHHGSAFQERAFIDAIRPAVALVPVGADNRYGHPDPGVLARLAVGGARVLRTDLDGDLAVVQRAGRLAVVTRRLGPIERAR